MEKMVIFRKISNCISYLLLRITSSQRSQFLCSFILGAVFAVSVRLYQASTDQFGDTDPVDVAEYDWAYEKWLYSTGFLSEPRDPDVARYGGRNKNI